MKDKFVRYLIPVLLFGVFVCSAWAQEQALPELSLTEVREIELPQGFTEGLKDGSLTSPNSSLWFVAGCLFPLPGLIVSAAYSPKFNPQELEKITQLKGQNYATGYAKAYETKARNKNLVSAATGFGISISISLIISSLSNLASATTMANPEARTDIPIQLIKELRYDTH
ncbi:MAG TPA: hypothetical protein PKI63_04325 [Candidatus Cloacimonadota bacterium]|nr:hypothetical protein [Candidatus Cloacimonadota bacterium]HOH78728.1 hypothetical protein [Candidatus Cloacimonadota bacterium]HPN40931.1 hypothetical protein [Candidatus Cloacimonadota bacterium]